MMGGGNRQKCTLDKIIEWKGESMATVLQKKFLVQ